MLFCNNKLVSNRKYNEYNIYFEKIFINLPSCQTKKCLKNHVLTTSFEDTKLHWLKQNMFDISFNQNLIIPRSCVLEFFTVSRFRRARIDCYKTGNGRTELPYKVKVSISFCFSYITVYQAYLESVRNTVKLKNKKRNNAIYLNPSCKDWKWLPTKWIALKTYCIKCQSTM